MLIYINFCFHIYLPFTLLIYSCASYLFMCICDVCELIKELTCPQRGNTSTNSCNARDTSYSLKSAQSNTASAACARYSYRKVRNYDHKGFLSLILAVDSTKALCVSLYLLNIQRSQYLVISMWSVYMQRTKELWFAVFWWYLLEC